MGNPMGFLNRSSSENDHLGGPLYALTKHAGVRVQQRGVDRRVLYCLHTYGHREPDHKGCQVSRSMGQALAELAGPEYRPAMRRASDSRNFYAVVYSTGVVTTAGHRFRRIPRTLSLSSFRPGRTRSPRTLKSLSLYRQNGTSPSSKSE
jgi:hypothetical protein